PAPRESQQRPASEPAPTRSRDAAKRLVRDHPPLPESPAPAPEPPAARESLQRSALDHTPTLSERSDATRLVPDAPKLDDPRRREPADGATGMLLRQILQELRNQHAARTAFNVAQIIAIVLQIIAAVCLVGGLWMGSDD